MEACRRRYLPHDSHTVADVLRVQPCQITRGLQWRGFCARDSAPSAQMRLFQMDVQLLPADAQRTAFTGRCNYDICAV